MFFTVKKNILAVLLLLLCTFAKGQTFTISGSVIDSLSGSLLPNPAQRQRSTSHILCRLSNPHRASPPSQQPKTHLPPQPLYNTENCSSTRQTHRRCPVITDECRTNSYGTAESHPRPLRRSRPRQGAPTAARRPKPTESEDSSQHSPPKPKHHTPNNSTSTHQSPHSQQPNHPRSPNN